MTMIQVTPSLALPKTTREFFEKDGVQMVSVLPNGDEEFRVEFPVATLPEGYVRTAEKLSGDFLPEELEAIRAWSAKWAANMMRTDRADAERVRRTVNAMYEIRQNSKVVPIVLVESPLQTAILGMTAVALRHALTVGERPLVFSKLSDRSYPTGISEVYGARLEVMTEALEFLLNPENAGKIFDARRADLGHTSEFPLSAYKAWVFHSCAKVGLTDREDVNFVISTIKNFTSVYQGGNLWSSTTAYLSAFDAVLNVEIKNLNEFLPWQEAAKNGGFRIYHDAMCVVSDHPTAIHRNSRDQMHNTTGPSHAWSDGHRAYSVNGVTIPDNLSKYLDDHNLLTPEVIEGISNQEVQRVMLEIYGYERFFNAGGFDLVAENGADEAVVGLRNAAIFRKRMAGGEWQYVVRLQNSTAEPDGSFKKYVLALDHEAYDGRAAEEVLAAVASTFRNNDEDNSLFWESPEDYAESLGIES